VGIVYHPDIMEGIRAGDVVVGLFGTSLPFVLRPINSKQEYEMVNFAFIADHDYVYTGLESAPEGTTELDVWKGLREVWTAGVCHRLSWKTVRGYHHCIFCVFIDRRKFGAPPIEYVHTNLTVT
jgi:hypothetical protein